MSIVGALIDDKAAALQTLYPNRLVTRTLKDFTEHKADELQAGVYALVANKVTGKRFQEYVHFILAVDIAVPKAQGREKLEEAELICAEELKTWAYQNQVEIVEQFFSKQRGFPDGWVMCNMKFGPLDLYDVDISALSPFELLHVEHTVDGDNVDNPAAVTEETST